MESQRSHVSTKSILKHKVKVHESTADLSDFLQRENKSIQKQFLKAKSELYEAKFKNQALKGKVEKLWAENQAMRNKMAEGSKAQRDVEMAKQKYQNKATKAIVRL